MSDNPYHEIPYTTVPRLSTHPDRLAAVGTLFGMTPAPVTHCRVLEIGCGNGGNLIPMAYGLPESRFTGVDLAAEAIAAGQATIAALGLTNISLLPADLRDIGPDCGEFDYILAHGVYSWVPPDVRDRLVAVCRERLAPHGIAFISYNVYPGRHVRQMLREMMLYHTRNIPDLAECIRQARWFLQLLRDGRAVPSRWHALLDGEIEALLERDADGLCHDDLAEINDPVYFRDFAAHAARHGLQYLGEADPYEMFDQGDRLAWLEGDVIEREQYLDFLRVRRFRQTLLCYEGIALQRQPGPALMERFLFSAPAQTIEGGKIQGMRGIRITAVHEAVNRVAAALGETYPLPLAFEELVPYAGDRDALREILFGLVVGGFADIHVYDFPCEETVTAKPRASRLARHQAAISPYVTGACQHVVKLDEVARHLVCLMDGTRDHRQLAHDLAAIPGAPTADRIAEHLLASLEWLARMSLLEG
ncbi:Methyltransferase type 12 [Candidatus Sulfopaludibacter sp. SbA4]|nr:Methyltransferase type 12 [Candidatus Sulfopaludibacter sp. SbA4]